MPGATRRTPNDPDNPTPASSRVRTTKRTTKAAPRKAAATKSARTAKGSGAAASTGAGEAAAATSPRVAEPAGPPATAARARRATPGAAAKPSAAAKPGAAAKPSVAAKQGAAAKPSVAAQASATTASRAATAAAEEPVAVHRSEAAMPSAMPSRSATSHGIEVRPQSMSQALRAQVGGAAADAADTVQARVHDLADYVRQRGNRTTADKIEALVERLREANLSSRPVSEWPALAQDLVREQPLVAASVSAAAGFAAAGALTVLRRLKLGRLVVGAAAGAVAVRALSRREGQS